MPSRKAIDVSRDTFKEGLRRAGNDAERIEFQRDGSVIVWNNSEWPVLMRSPKITRNLNRLRFHESH